MSICRREGETDDAGDMGPNCYRGLEPTALSTQTEAEYLGTGAGGLGDASGDLDLALWICCSFPSKNYVLL